MPVDHEFAVLALVPLNQAAYSPAALEELFARGPARAADDQWSAADFWHHTTGGEVRLRPRILPPVFLSTADPDWAAVNVAQNAGANQQMASLVRRFVTPATMAAVQSVVIISQWAVADAGYCFDLLVDVERPDGTQGLARRPGVYLSTADSQSIISHELGHALGFEHPLGVLSTQGGQLTSEYGSPYCVMGTASRWDQVSVDRTPRVGSAVPATDGFWTNGGPDLSRAALISWGWDRPINLTWSRHVPWDEATTPVRLGDRGSHTTRAVVYGSFDDQCIIAEYRRPLAQPAPDYDAALSFDFVSDTDLYDGPGVVVHEVRNLTGRGRRCFYLGTIPVPAQGIGDLEILGSLGRRLVLQSTEDNTVQIRMTGQDPVLKPTITLSTALEARRSPAPSAGFGQIRQLRSLPYQVSMTGPGCKTNTFWGTRREQRVTIHVQARTFGLEQAGLNDQLEFTWRVAGVTGGPARLDGFGVNWTVPMTTEVGVPSASEYQTWHGEQRSMVLDASATWASLAVECPPGDGRYEVTIEVTAGPPGVMDGPKTASARISVQVETERIAFGPALGAAGAECGRFLKELVDALPETRVGVVLKKVNAKPIPRLTRLEGAQLLVELAAGEAEAEQLRELERLRTIERTRFKLPDLRRRGPGG